MSVSVNTVRPCWNASPGGSPTTPGVAERLTLVAEQENRVAAAAHLLRYFPNERAGAAARDHLWGYPVAARPGRDPACPLVLARLGTPWPFADQPRAWPSSGTGASAAIKGAASCPTRRDGVPEQRPNVPRAIPGRPGSPTPGTPRSSTWPGWKTCRARPVPRWPDCRRAARVGINGAALAVGCVRGQDAHRLHRGGDVQRGRAAHQDAGGADVGNLHVTEPYRRQRWGSWLRGQAADWFELARTSRPPAHLRLARGHRSRGFSYDDYRNVPSGRGLPRATRTQRGWTRPAS